jgi:hypothetical protein
MDRHSPPDELAKKNVDSASNQLRFEQHKRNGKLDRIKLITVA